MKYRLANNLAGWGVFLVAMVAYLLTVAPTASFWDCGEFIATANELEVPHPPGAPLFLMMGRFFAMFAPDPTHVALMVNLVSVVMSALLALFICWTTTMLARKILAPNNAEPEGTAKLTILLSGIVAGLTCTFLDTVWFNAVEAEVYAASSAFTACTFWLMLKWEARADEPDNLKWIVLVAFVIGLSVGVHLLPLLTLPALVLIYYFRKYEYTFWSMVLALGISVVILVVVQYGVVQKTWDVAWAFERFFTGSEAYDGSNKKGLGMPYGTGTFVFALLLLGGLGFGIWYSHKKGNALLNVSLMSVLMIYIGFSSYAVIAIRSNANPPIDQNHPGNLINFLSYLKREQYGNTPLLYGQMYNSEPTGTVNLEPLYFKLSTRDRYIQEGQKQDYKYEPSTLRFFPRMHNREHYTSGPFGYSTFVKNKGADPNNPMDDKPTGRENLAFFFQYQVYHMYFRYLLWNYVGRESDIQHADWESGLNFKELRDMPKEMRESRTRNHYYFLPLIIALLGFLWHMQYDSKRFFAVFMLFLFTGLMIVLYLNQVAQEPRERDYAFVGSYHTMAIWSGLGVAAIATLLHRLGRLAPVIAGVVCLAGSPAILLAENWDDHNRTGVYVPPDSAYNLLNSCDPNAILFTNGDNDTFPLWYLQEVEGVRTDVRVVNLSLLNTDWYIHQLKHQKWNESEPLPISVDENFYMGERNAAVPFPARSFNIPFETEQLVKAGVLSAEQAARSTGFMSFEVRPRGSKDNPYLMKQDLMVLDMLLTNAKNGWGRPIYFANTVGRSSFIGLEAYFEMHSLAYRILPVKPSVVDPMMGFGGINLPKTYDRLVTNGKYRGLNDPSIFFGENIDRMVGNYRASLMRLSGALLDEAERLEDQNPVAAAASGRSEQKRNPEIQSRIDSLKNKSKEVIAFTENTITEQAIPVTPSSRLYSAVMYDRMGNRAQALAELQKLEEECAPRLQYLLKYYTLIESRDDMSYFLDQALGFYVRAGEYDKAKALATRMFQITGNAVYSDLIKQIDNPQAAPGQQAPQGR